MEAKILVKGLRYAQKYADFLVWYNVPGASDFKRHIDAALEYALPLQAGRDNIPQEYRAA